MSCYSPLYAFGRRDRPFEKMDIHFIDFHPDASLKKIEYDGKTFDIPLQIPCGQCIGCRLEYSRRWAVRCMLEAQQYDHNFFITLTYNDENLPERFNYPEKYEINEKTGEVLEESFLNDYVISHPLQRKDLTDFIKRFRSYCQREFNHTGIRIFYSGEYGDQSARPHYHILFFNLPKAFKNDLLFLRTTPTGLYFTSPLLDKLWPYGYNVVGELNFQSAAYVARYVVKKRKGKDSLQWYVDRGLTPEFCGMSRRPGIARNYYDSEKNKIYRFDSLVVTGSNGKPLKVKPDRYFDRLFEDEFPLEFELLRKERSEKGENARKLVLQKTSLKPHEYLSVQEGNTKSRIIRLKRSL